VDLRIGDRPQLADATAIVGGGKTKLLERLRSELSAKGASAMVLRIELGESDAESGEQPDRAQLQAFARFREIVGNLIEQIIQVERNQGGSADSTKRAFEPVEHALQAAAGNTTPFNITQNIDARSATLNQSPIGNISLKVDEGFLDKMVTDGEQDIAETFAVTFAEVLKNRTAVLTIDGFEWVAATPLGAWVLDLVRRLKWTRAVVAHTPDANLIAQPKSDLVACPLAPLTSREIEQLLEKSLPGQAIDRPLVDVVTEFSSGHPHTAGLAAELLQRLSPEQREAKTFEQRLAALPSDLAKRHSDLVDAIIEHDPPDIARGVRACAILRRFDAGLLEALLPDQAGKGGELIEQLQRYTFIEPVQDPRGGFFRIHEFIRAELDRRLEDFDPAAYARLHGAAAEHISAWLNAYKETSTSMQYGSWYRYESPDWQGAVREWLYHQSRAAAGPGADKERVLGRQRFAGIVLDAFWWWGLYLDFPFIRDLLDDWRDSQADRDWAVDLRNFVADYPTGYRKDPDPAGWDRVFQALLSVRASCGLAGPDGALDEQQRHIRGLIDLFMAHSKRFRAPDASYPAADLYAAARRHYDEAMQIFRGDGDDWDLAWTYFESSDLETEHAGALAQQHWKAAVDLLANKDLGDDELTANLYRVAADAAWPNEPLKAFADHGSAIWYAYLFQGRYQRSRYRPDAYTLQFYREQLERATSRLFEHFRKGGDPAAAVARLRAPLPKGVSVDAAQLKVWCAAGDAVGIALLFPAPPPPDQLMLTSSPFLLQWEADLEKVSEPLAVCDASAW